MYMFMNQEKAQELTEDELEVVQVISQSPDSSLTFEEEFKIHELVVRREVLLLRMVEAIFELPQGQVWSMNLQPGRGEGLVTGGGGRGRVLACLDIFDMYKHVEEVVKVETFNSSIQLIDMCLRW